MPRFVVLRHETPPGADRESHFDFMLEDGGKLLTWTLPAPPQAGSTMAATPLPDHRLAYLDYEGPISGGRGRVTRWDAGAFEWLERGDELLRLRLTGSKFSGIATIARVQYREPQKGNMQPVAWTHFSQLP